MTDAEAVELLRLLTLYPWGDSLPPRELTVETLAGDLLDSVPRELVELTLVLHLRGLGLTDRDAWPLQTGSTLHSVRAPDTYDDSGGYELSDPKHPTYHDRYSG